MDGRVDLSASVQAALTAAGSLQQIGPLPFAVVERSILSGYGFVLQVAGRRIGSVLVDPLESTYLSTRTPGYIHWSLSTFSAPFWYLHALMLDPANRARDWVWLLMSK